MGVLTLAEIVPDFCQACAGLWSQVYIPDLEITKDHFHKSKPTFCPVVLLSCYGVCN